LLSGALLPAAAQSSDKCFRSDWLQASHSIIFKIDGVRVSGTFTVSGDGEEMNYDFTGTRGGNTLTIKFTGGKMPDISPSEMKSPVWTLAKKGAEEVLKIRVYGKNYVTNKYATTWAEYGSCRPSYAGLRSKAKPVSFTKGVSSAAMKVTFANKNEWKTFSIATRKGQKLEIDAPGCFITLYLPDKTLYDFLENPGQADSGKSAAGLDMMKISPLLQGGNYLIAVQAAGDELGARKITVKITN
jgi:hypothetical protein